MTWASVPLPLSSQHLDAVEARALGHPVDGPADDAGNVRAVAVAVGGLADEALDLGGSATEFLGKKKFL